MGEMEANDRFSSFLFSIYYSLFAGSASEH